MYHEGKAYVIDVSQSVEHDHPNALEFLRKDLTNVNEVFRKKKINVLTVKELFDFVVDPNIQSGKEEDALVITFFSTFLNWSRFLKNCDQLLRRKPNFLTAFLRCGN